MFGEMHRSARSDGADPPLSRCHLGTRSVTRGLEFCRGGANATEQCRTGWEPAGSCQEIIISTLFHFHFCSDSPFPRMGGEEVEASEYKQPSSPVLQSPAAVSGPGWVWGGGCGGRGEGSLAWVAGGGTSVIDGIGNKNPTRESPWGHGGEERGCSGVMLGLWGPNRGSGGSGAPLCTAPKLPLLSLCAAEG